MASIADHLRNPHVGIEQHIGERCQSLADDLANKRAIYLDLRFWIYVRDAGDGTTADPDLKKLAHYLKLQVKRGVIFCPISVTLFQELLKIGGANRREATVAIVEELSTGVTLMPEPDRVESEIEALIFSAYATEPNPLPSRVWTRLVYIYGNYHPVDTGLPRDDELAIQKAFFDRMWNEPLSNVIAQIDPAKFNSIAENGAIAEKLNKGNQAHRDQMSSFENVLTDELYGAADCGEPILNNILNRLETFATGTVQTPLSEPNMVGRNLLHHVLLGDNAGKLPTLHVHGALHALLRWEYKDKQIEGNHVFDYQHAAAALAYGDAFFTEGELARHIRHKRMNLAEFHNCYVTNNTTEALAFVRSLTSK